MSRKNANEKLNAYFYFRKTKEKIRTYPIKNLTVLNICIKLDE